MFRVCFRAGARLAGRLGGGPGGGRAGIDDQPIGRGACLRLARAVHQLAQAAAHGALVLLRILAAHLPAASGSHPCRIQHKFIGSACILARHKQEAPGFGTLQHNAQWS